MSNDQFIMGVFLGAGGRHPAVVRAMPGEPLVSRVLAMPAGNSVYAMDVDARNRRIAAGTRAGRIELIACPDDGAEPRAVRSLEQGAPVVSVCFVADSMLASTDTAGRCLLWREPLEDPGGACSLEVGGGIICSVLALDDGKMLGLCSAGRLLFWDLAGGGQSLQSIDCPAPPGRLSLVKLVHWPRHNVVAYPGPEGHLVLCDLDKRQVRKIHAHGGDSFAVFPVDQGIVTIGTNDGLAKGWREVSPTLAWQCNAGPGIIGGREVDRRTGQVLLLAEDGRASIHVIEGGDLRRQYALPGGDYRAAASARPEIQLAFQQDQQQAKAKDLQTQIRQRLADGQEQTIEPLHQQLVELGFPAVSLALRAKCAASREDLIAELSARHALSRVLPGNNDRRAMMSLRAYAAILRRAWLLREAQAIQTRITIIGTDEDDDWLAPTARAMEGEDWAAETDLPLCSLIQAATIVGRPFTGRWVLKSFRNIQLPESRIQAADLTSRYEQVRKEDGRPGLPAPMVRSIRWLSRKPFRTSETVILSGSVGQTTEGAELAIQIQHDGLQTIVLQSLLLNANPGSGGNSSDRHNDRIAEILDRVSRAEQIGPWVQEVRQVVYTALRRLRTEGLSPRPD